MSYSYQLKTEPAMDSMAPSFQALGIAFVVDRVGKGAHMVLRYPACPLGGVSSQESANSNEDLFFRLTPQQLAKLFRPKSTLCGRPMTLTVGGTVFCCFSVLMDKDQNTSDVAVDGCSSDENRKNDPSSLNLFSVIVALVPKIQLSSIPVAGWFEEQISSDMDSQQRTASESFLSLRRVHISLSRLCRILEREEQRCSYVSIQSQHILETWNVLKLDWEQRCSQQSTSDAGTGGATTTTTTATTKSSPTLMRPHHRRHRSFTPSTQSDLFSSVHAQQTGTSQAAAANSSNSTDLSNSIEFIQVFLDAIMAINNNDADSIGNLARELAETYHALSRNENGLQPTADILMSGRDGVVFINRHLAFVVEPIFCPVGGSGLPDGMQSQTTTNTTIYPYQTLLFPHASCATLLESLSVSTPGPPRRLVQMLSVAHPQKSLIEMSREAMLPLKVALDMAKFLLEQGVAIAASVLSAESYLSCSSMARTAEVSLAFSQTFGEVLSVFHAVAYVCDKNRSLREALTAWKESDEDQWFRERLLASALSSERVLPNGGRMLDGDPDDAEDDRMHLSALEEVLFQMIVWLYSRRVLVQSEEYLVAIGRSEASGTDGSDVEHNVDTAMRPEKMGNDSLFRELLSLGFLDGKTSLKSLSWQTGVDQHRLRSLASQHERIRLLRRVPTV